MESFYSFACSVIGKSHLDRRMVLQDASNVYEDESCSVIVVSDGHGSENFPRSDRGSKIACTVAVEAVREFLADLEPARLRSDADRDDIVSQLCKNILWRWNKAVRTDADEDPFTEEEASEVKEKYRSAYLAGERVAHAYGATLLLAILTRDFFLALRNGDGECVTMDEQGHFATPVPGNDKNEASFVTSLCDEDAIEDFRYFYTEAIPVAVMLGSDGVENSYVHTEELFSLYRNVCRKAAREGGPATKKEVERALSVITARGSGDDVSVACCLNLVQLQAVLPALDQAAARRREQLTAEKAAKQHQACIQHVDADHAVPRTDNDQHCNEQRAQISECSAQADDAIEARQEELRTQKPQTVVSASPMMPESDGTIAPKSASVSAGSAPDDFQPPILPELRRINVSDTASVVKETAEVGMSGPIRKEKAASSNGLDSAHPPV